MLQNSIVLWPPLFVVIIALGGGCAHPLDEGTTGIMPPTQTHMDTATADRTGTPPLADVRTAVPALTSPLPGDAAPDSTAVSQPVDIWEAVRAAMPAHIPVYQPTFVPERFDPPTLLEARGGEPDGPRYTVSYPSQHGSLVFILNMGKGAYGNFPRPDTREPLAIHGTRGELMTSTEAQTLGVFWQDAGQSYQIKAYAMTPDELRSIVASLVLVEK